MSGLEILVVPALVAAFVCALNDGRDLLAAYKKRRLMKKQSSEVESLDQSLTTISTAIQSSLNSLTNQFGNRFKNDCKSAIRPFIECPFPSLFYVRSIVLYTSAENPRTLIHSGFLQIYAPSLLGALRYSF